MSIFLKKKKSLLFFVYALLIILTVEVIYKLVLYHPFQYVYFNNLVPSKIKNLFEIDYQSLSRTEALKLILIDSKNKNEILISNASWTHLKNGISLLNKEDQKKLIFLGTDDKENADYIYTNYIYDTDPAYKKKYEIPNNFYLFKSIYRDGIKIYSIYKKKS